MPRGERPRAKVAQLSQKERITIDGMIRREKASATEAWRRINRDRVRLGVPEVGKSAVHRYARGVTHKLGAEENRGRKHALNEANIKALEQARLRLIKKADNEYRVTWANIVSEAGLEGVVSERVCADALRSRGVRFTTPRRKIQVSEEDAKKRLATAPAHTERKDEFLARLRRIAKSLPKPFVRSVVAQMKRRLRDLIASKGFAPKND